MRHYKASACAAAILVLSFAVNTYPHSGPFDGKNFKGRIAFSSDGNYNDEDDWGAFPVAIAMLDAFGVADKLVHVDYCNILAKNDPRFYREMSQSVLGSAERYNIPRSILFDCQKDLPRSRTPHFKKIAETIAQAGNAGAGLIGFAFLESDGVVHFHNSFSAKKFAFI